MAKAKCWHFDAVSVKSMKLMFYTNKFEFYTNTVTRVFVLVWLAFAGALPLWAAKPTTATAIEVVTKGETTRFFAELTAETGFSALILAEPYRVIIDMANVSFDLPPGAGRKANGLIKQIRYGIIEKGKSRIVIDTNGPVLIKQSQLLPRKGKTKPRMKPSLPHLSAMKRWQKMKPQETPRQVYLCLCQIRQFPKSKLVVD
jgi:AMIN domain